MPDLTAMPPLPAEFIDMLRGADADIFTDLPAALDGEAPSVAIRLNPAKAAGLDTAAPLADGAVAWEPMGRYLAERPRFTFDPLLHQGAYYVQDPSSMITGHIIRSLLPSLPPRPLAYLDACAAPGGKTTAAIAALPEGSIVVANEFTPSRVAPLAENLSRWGAPGAVVTAGPVDRFTPLRDTFDIIAVDAPCSGEGMMRKDAEARRQWSPGLTEHCAALQREILAATWPALRPGGYLIYSTCTFNPLENEDNLRWIVDTLGAEPVSIPVPPAAGIAGPIRGDLPAMRFIPGRIRGEGLFIAVVRKPGDLPAEVGAPAPRVRKRAADKGKTATPAAAVDLAALVTDPAAFTIAPRRDGTLDLIPASPLLHPAIAADCRATITLCTVKGRDLIPDTSLAWSGILRPDAFPAADIGPDDALAFLRHEAITLPSATPRGFILLRHAGLPLGFVKNLGNRANNLHRPSWRVLSQGSPSTILAKIASD